MTYYSVTWNNTCGGPYLVFSSIIQVTTPPFSRISLNPSSPYLLYELNVISPSQLLQLQIDCLNYATKHKYAKISKIVSFCRFYRFLCKNAVPWLSPRTNFWPSIKLYNTLYIKCLQGYKWALKKYFASENNPRLAIITKHYYWL